MVNGKETRGEIEGVQNSEVVNKVLVNLRDLVVEDTEEYFASIYQNIFFINIAKKRMFTNSGLTRSVF